MRKQRKAEIAIIIIVILGVLLTAGYMKFFNGKLVYISTGMKKTEFFKVGGLTAEFGEADILLSDARKEYENIFGEDIWNQSIGDVTFDEYVREQVKAKLIRIYCMNLLAAQKGTTLSRIQREGVANAVDAYYAGLTQAQISEYSITKDKLNELFTSYAIADNLYSDMTSSETFEVSYDEARVIRIQYICADSETDIKEAKRRIDNGETFYTVAKDYNPDEYERECRRGELESSFEEAAFNLATGEVSDIVSAGGRYYIIKCSSDNDKSKTDENKSSMEEKLRLEYFNSIFEEYEQEYYVEINTSVWNTKKISRTEIFDVSFEEIYNQYLN